MEGREDVAAPNHKIPYKASWSSQFSPSWCALRLPISSRHWRKPQWGLRNPGMRAATINGAKSCVKVEAGDGGLKAV